MVFFCSQGWHVCQPGSFLEFCILCVSADVFHLPIFLYIVLLSSASPYSKFSVENVTAMITMEQCACLEQLLTMFSLEKL